MKNLVLIDGHSLAYRMYFALERTGMKTATQFPTWGVYGFFKALFDLLKQVEPDGMAIAFDKGKATFRHQMYSEYKATRQAMPDSLREQMVKIREGVELLGIPVFEEAEFEADDLIGTLARQAAAQGTNVTVLTGDQDAFQILDDDGRISLLVPGFTGGLTRYDRQKVFEKWGVYPEQVTDFKGLKGDTSDNIPGVPGVGDKTAAKLLAEYQTLENVLANVETVSGKKLKESLVTYREQAILSKQLATIRYDAPVAFAEEACHLAMPDVDDFMAFLVEMEFRSFIKQSDTLLKPFLSHADPNKLPVHASQSKAPNSGQLNLLGVPAVEAGVVAVAEKPVETQTEKPHVLLAVHQVPFELVMDETALKNLVAEIQTHGVCAIDIETSSLDVLNLQFAGISITTGPGLTIQEIQPANKLGLKDYPQTLKSLALTGQGSGDLKTVYIPLCHADSPPCLDEKTVFEALKPIFEDPAIAKIAHNAKFELNAFRQVGINWQGLVFDTMILSYVLDANRRHGLKALAHDVLGYQMQEITELIGTGKKQIPFTQVRLEDAAPYAACDSCVTYELVLKLLPQLDADLTSLLYELELPLVPVLADMEWQGVSLDTLYLKSLSTQLEAQIIDIEQEIYAMAGESFNLNSPKQVGDILFGKLGIPARGMTPTKSGYTTNAKVIESLAPDYPIVQKLLDYRQLFKLKSTYVDALPNLINPKDHRLHTSFNQTVAATGRLSSSDPNLQNIPIRSDVGRSIRQGFVPENRETCEFLSADYSQIELRLLAHFSEDPNLVQAFQSGEDIHKATAALVFEVPLDEVTKEMRYQAKAVNFGIIYGQTAFGLSNALEISPKEAAAFIDKYFEQYPNVRTFIETTKQEVRDTGKATTICGRVRDLSEGLGSSVKSIREFSERAGFNTPLQGSAADIMKVAMIRLFHALKREKLQSRLILQVHDEVVLEVDKAERDRIKELVLWAMELDQPLNVPLVVDMAEGATWMEAD